MCVHGGLCDDRSIMTTAAPRPPAAEGYEPRRAYRRTGDRWLGGVAAGLAEHLGLPTRVVRVLFVVGGVLGGFGVLLYAGLWLALPVARPEDEPAGLAAARRQGKRPDATGSWVDSGFVVALVVLAVGVALFLQVLTGWGLGWWPALIALGGVALLWRQADEAEQERMAGRGRLGTVRALVGQGGAAAFARVGVGVVLLVLALLVFAVRSGDLSVARDMVLTAVLAGAGLAFVLAPWILRLARDLSSERAERIRSQERADVAAHLHDSVLQTLALIQKHAGDERAVATLARSQERDLRAWLFDDAVPDGGTIAGELRRAAAEIEDAHAVPVEIVVVGDRPFDECSRPLVLAAREAMANAAKHAGAPRVDVYAEITDAQAEIFVRDRGVGFDPDAMAEDRLGVRRSIIDRMGRHGGRAVVRSAPGEGTEIRLQMPLTATDQQERP